MTTTEKQQAADVQTTDDGPFPFEVQTVAQERAQEPPPPAPSPEVAAGPERKENTSLVTSDDGVLALASIEQQVRFAATLIKNSMISSSFKNPNQVVIGMQYLKELNMPVVAGMRLLYVVNNRPCLYSEGPLMLVQRTKKFESIEEFFIDEDGERISFTAKNLKKQVYASITRVQRIGDPNVQEDYFTLDDLDAAGLEVGKNGPKDVWLKWKRLMMRYKARAIALRSKFADVIGGIPVAEYDEHFSPEIPQIAPTVRSDIAGELNKTFLEAGNDAKE